MKADSVAFLVPGPELCLSFCYCAGISSKTFAASPLICPLITRIRRGGHCLNTLCRSLDFVRMKQHQPSAEAISTEKIAMNSVNNNYAGIIIDNSVNRVGAAEANNSV